MEKNEFLELVKKHNFDIPKCIHCNDIIFYENGKYSVASFGKHKGELLCYATTYKTTKVVNDKTYNLCVCEECLRKNFPDYDEKNKSRIFNQPNKYSQYAFNIPVEEINAKKHELCARTEEAMIKKYGEEEGKKRWQIYCDKQSITNTFEYKKEKYGWSKKDFNNYNKSRAVTLENLIKKYGNEEGQERWDAYCERQRHTCSLEYFIEKYGEDKGTIEFNRIRNAWIEAGHENLPCAISKVSEECFDILHKKYFKNNKVQYGTELGERMVQIDNKYYHLDYYDETLSISVEFNGDLWHCNPTKYNAEDIFIHPFDKSDIKKAKDVWEKDKIRQNKLESTGLKVFVIWESDYKKNKNKCVDDLANRINEYVNSTKIKKQKTNSLF